MVADHPVCDAAICACNLLSIALVLLQVTAGTVDEGIHALAKRKLKLDAAVLEGITAGNQSKQSSSATDAAQMGQLLQSLIAGSNSEEVLQENEHQNNVIAIE